jgi:hypothetical protein
VSRVTGGIRDGAKGRGTSRPQNAYKVLVHLIYSSLPTHISILEGGWIVVHSVRQYSKILGTSSEYYRKCLSWLEGMGYIETMEPVNRGRGVRLKVRQPHVSGI